MKETIIEVMNRNGYSLTNEAKLIDLVLTIKQHQRIVTELTEVGLFVEAQKNSTHLQVA